MKKIILFSIPGLVTLSSVILNLYYGFLDCNIFDGGAWSREIYSPQCAVLNKSIYTLIAKLGVYGFYLIYFLTLPFIIKSLRKDSDPKVIKFANIFFSTLTIILILPLLFLIYSRWDEIGESFINFLTGKY